MDYQGHDSPGTSSKTLFLAEEIFSNNGNAHHLNSDHNTTSVSYPEGSTNGNVNSENILTLGRETPHITRERSFTTNTGDSHKTGGYRSCFE
eukprot:3587168-Ditylum_brightwellii.AAC.1